MRKLHPGCIFPSILDLVGTFGFITVKLFVRLYETQLYTIYRFAQTGDNIRQGMRSSRRAALGHEV